MLAARYAIDEEQLANDVTGIPLRRKSWVEVGLSARELLIAACVRMPGLSSTSATRGPASTDPAYRPGNPSQLRLRVTAFGRRPLDDEACLFRRPENMKDKSDNI